MSRMLGTSLVMLAALMGCGSGNEEQATTPDTAVTREQTFKRACIRDLNDRGEVAGGIVKDSARAVSVYRSKVEPSSCLVSYASKFDDSAGQFTNLSPTGVSPSGGPTWTPTGIGEGKVSDLPREARNWNAYVTTQGEVALLGDRPNAAAPVPTRETPPADSNNDITPCGYDRIVTTATGARVGFNTTGGYDCDAAQDIVQRIVARGDVAPFRCEAKINENGFDFAFESHQPLRARHLHVSARRR